jgi:succinate dehydrogenase / fumarate reductase iron-sulfur subunit
MHPIDQGDRLAHLKEDAGVGYCNITKCCTEVCPEHIKITDNAIIPLKERVADEYYDPFRVLWRKLRGERQAQSPEGDVTASDDPVPATADGEGGPAHAHGA